MQFKSPNQVINNSVLLNDIILNGNITQNTGDHLLSVGNMTLVSGYLSLGGILKDGAASDGTAGQVLTSTGTATSWVDQKYQFAH